MHNLEASFAENHPRALIPMATGAGKTFTAVSFIYRLIKTLALDEPCSWSIPVTWAGKRASVLK